MLALLTHRGCYFLSEDMVHKMSLYFVLFKTLAVLSHLLSKTNQQRCTLLRSSLSQSQFLVFGP